MCVYVRAASILHSRFAYLDEACGLDRGIGIFLFFNWLSVILLVEIFYDYIFF